VSPDGRFFYVDHETDSEVSVFTVKDGALQEIQTLSTLPPGAETRNTTAEILISGDGRHLYVTNRGHDSIAVFAVDRATGLLTRTENIPSGGRTPRNIRLSPDGDYLFAANENGGNITQFRVDKTNGHLTPTGVTVPIDTPGGMYFAKVR
jgi:6-phosphogluconolactonase